jgi:AP2 domain
MKRGDGRPLQECEFKQYAGLPMTSELAKILWSYNPLTGALIWNGDAHARHAKKGDQAGTINFHGYRVVTFYGKKFKTSRLAFLIMTGEWPPTLAEHENAIRSDDRWENLRNATQSENMCNKSTMSNNKLGIKGVSQSKDGKFHAYICFAGKRKNLGTFATAELAKSAYDCAAQEWHGEFSRAA